MFRQFTVALAFVAALGLSSQALRGEEDDSSGKGKGKGATAAPAGKVIQIDLNKLPPDLAKALAKYAAGGDKKPMATTAPSKGKAAPAAKGKPAPAPAAKGKGAAQELPPGLAKKPASHPGRTHYIQHVLGGKVAAPAGKGAPGKYTPPAKPGKGKGSQEEED